jgi:hypothetical protein
MLKGKLKRWLVRIGVTLLALVFVLAIWIAIDLNLPVKTEIRRFDPNEVARLDTAMWRSYYGKQPVKMFGELTELLRTQYRMPFWRSNLTAFYAARAAFIFKDGKNRADYERALPDLIWFYKEIQAASDIKFDVEKAARLELEWWIVHRERAKHQPTDLENALAATAAEIYQMPPEKFIEHGRFRAKAMKIRDTKAEQGGVSEEDWRQIDELLHKSWQSLFAAVNS